MTCRRKGARLKLAGPRSSFASPSTEVSSVPGRTEPGNSIDDDVRDAAGVPDVAGEDDDEGSGDEGEEAASFHGVELDEAVALLSAKLGMAVLNARRETGFGVGRHRTADELVEAKALRNMMPGLLQGLWIFCDKVLRRCWTSSLSGKPSRASPSAPSAQGGSTTVPASSRIELGFVKQRSSGQM